MTTTGTKRRHGRGGDVLSAGGGSSWTSMNGRRAPAVGAIVRTTVLAGFGLVAVIPIIWVAISSFKPLPQLLGKPLAFPTSFGLANFTGAFDQFSFLVYIRNSLIVTVSATALTLILSVTAGYALAKYNFRGRDMLFIVVLGTLMIPVQVILVPIYQVVVDLHLVNSLLGLIIPPAATPTGVFLMRQYFLSIPDEIIEAARIDGSGEFRTFLRVVLPNAKPVIIILAIISIGWRWNDFIWPLIIAQSPGVYTLPVALGLLSSGYAVPFNNVLAMVFVSMLPVLIMFIFLQRYIVEGIARTGLR